MSDAEDFLVDFLSPYAPEGGWQPEDFPQITVASIPYTSNPGIRVDPSMTIIPEGWLFIEVGNLRMAIPDREEWSKLVNMGERLWNTHFRDKQEQEGDSDVGTPAEGVPNVLPGLREES